MNEPFLFIVCIDIMNIDGSIFFKKGDPFTPNFFAAKSSDHNEIKSLHDRKSPTLINSNKEPLFSTLNHWWKHLNKNNNNYAKKNTLHRRHPVSRPYLHIAIEHERTLRLEKGRLHCAFLRIPEPGPLVPSLTHVAPALS